MHFAKSINGTTITQIGHNDVVTVPNELLTTPSYVYAWIYLHNGVNDGETRYQIKIPVQDRARPSEETTHEQESAITQAIAALNDGVSRAESAATAASSANEEAQGAAVVASQSSTYAQGSAQNAAQSEQNASNLAQVVYGYAQATAEDRQKAETAADTATTKATEAEDSALAAAVSAQQAKASETAAERSAQSMAFVTFELDPSGNLVMNNPDILGTTSFGLNEDGDLEVNI